MRLIDKYGDDYIIIIRLLIENKDKKVINESLHSASEKGNYRVVQLLLQNGADINYRYYSETPLLKALDKFTRKHFMDYLDPYFETTILLLINNGANIYYNYKKSIFFKSLTINCTNYIHMIKKEQLAKFILESLLSDINKCHGIITKDTINNILKMDNILLFNTIIDKIPQLIKEPYNILVNAIEKKSTLCSSKLIENGNIPLTIKDYYKIITEFSKKIDYYPSSLICHNIMFEKFINSKAYGNFMFNKKSLLKLNKIIINGIENIGNNNNYEDINILRNIMLKLNNKININIKWLDRKYLALLYARFKSEKNPIKNKKNNLLDLKTLIFGNLGLSQYIAGFV
jgi:hypothetical protein